MGAARVRSLLGEVTKLPESARVRLAERLLETLDGPAEPGAAKAWAAEIRRRSREIEEGRVKGVPWPVVKARARAARGRR